MKESLKIAIVIPVYNSASMLNELVQRICTVLNGRDFMIILVDDGSKDNSWAVLEDIKTLYPNNITAVKLSKNYGQHNALMCGFGFVKADVVVTMDDDLQHPPEEIPKLIAKYEETNADVVYGEYINRQHDIITATGSYIFNKSSSIESDKLGRGSAFRLLKSELAVKLFENHKQNFYFIDEIISWYTAHVEFAPVEHHPRKSGKSGYGKRKKILQYFNAKVNYSNAPLRWMTFLGITGSILTFCVGIYFVIKKLFFSVSVEGFTALIVTILFTSSIMLMCFGIVGQYMYRILQHQNHKPPFSIKKIV